MLISVVLFSLLWITKTHSYNTNDDAFVLIKGLKVTLGNSYLNITFHENATVKSLYKDGVNLVKNIDLETWYLDWNGEKAYFNPTSLNVVSNTTDKVHVAYIQQASPGLLYIEFHLVILRNVSGLYQYIKASNPTNETISLAELRTVHRFDHDLMPKVTNIVTKGETPDLTGRPTIQDTTWQLQDGSYWSKYDFCGYIRETPWFGVYGGGFGGWVVSASREYHSAGPLKQELLVHQNSLMLNYFHSTHFGTPMLDTPPGWSKFFGPVLIYINSGSEEEVQADAASQALIEQAQWPYSWVEDGEYPLSRGSISGKVTGQTKAMVVIYSSLKEKFDVQTLGYLYHIETDREGSFLLHNIRPGNYRIVAYPLSGQGSENFAQEYITVTAGGNVDIGLLDLPEPTGILWSIGETNRKSDSYRYSDEKRNFYWHTLPPSDLTFEIGTSNPMKDWYYAQTRKGVWKISYLDKMDNKPRILRLGIAAATGSLIFNVTTVHLQVDVNDFLVGDFKYENDKAIYRDALQSGNFYAETLTVPAEKVKNGENVVSLRILDGNVMYDAISLATIDLRTDDWCFLPSKHVYDVTIVNLEN